MRNIDAVTSSNRFLVIIRLIVTLQASLAYCRLRGSEAYLLVNSTARSNLISSGDVEKEWFPFCSAYLFELSVFEINMKQKGTQFFVDSRLSPGVNNFFSSEEIPKWMYRVVGANRSYDRCERRPLADTANTQDSLVSDLKWMERIDESKALVI